MAPRFDPADLPEFPTLEFEQALWAAGGLAAGLDEAGRGAWAGPVFAAAVILPADPGLLERWRGVRDSKQMTPAARERWAQRIRAESAAWGVGSASAGEIDREGILPATRLAMRRALRALGLTPAALLIDALRLPGEPLPQQALIKGDARCLSIAAASVLAKTTRDAVLRDLEQTYPPYGFARHKGYGTAQHAAALQSLGPCPEHRLTFAPVALAAAQFAFDKPLGYTI